MDRLPDPGAFGATFARFMEAMTDAALYAEGPLAERLREHLGTDPRALPATAADFSAAEHANLQLGLEAVVGDAEIVGYATRHAAFANVGLASLMSGEAMTGPVRPGPVQYTEIDVGDGRVVRCVAGGLYLARRDGVPLALVLSRVERPFGDGGLRLEGASPQPAAVSALLRDLRAAMRRRNVFRGKVISLHQDPDQTVTVQFHTVPHVARDTVILPDGALERLERQALGVTAQADRLRAAGRHLKRGVLLHGPPGTGKTLSVSYIIGAMPGRTTVLLTGRGLGLIEQAIGIARQLAPATVVFEDIDLVAAERTMAGHHGVLFDLLNQIEGLEADEDLLFLLTTNRPDIVEPALAARPGRIDLALEVPLPDEHARRRLVRLYAAGVDLDPRSEADIVQRTEGVTGAFVKELMRQATLLAALDGRPVAEAPDVLPTLDELLQERSALTRRLLGQPGDSGALDVPTAPPFDEMLRAFGAAGLPIPPGIE